MEQAVKDYRIGGGFAFMNAPFASHPNDERRAKETLDMMLGDNLTLNQMRSLFQAYVDKQGGSLEFKERQMARVAERLGGWIK
jgi:hypothetical protein